MVEKGTARGMGSRAHLDAVHVATVPRVLKTLLTFGHVAVIDRDDKVPLEVLREAQGQWVRYVV